MTEVLTADLVAVEGRLRANLAVAEGQAAKLVETMIAIGEDLIAARDLVPHGELDAWARDQIGLHPKTVRTYIRFATHAEILREHQPKGTLEARKLLTEMGVPQLNSADALRVRAKELEKEGLNHREIAERMEISRPRVSQLLNPEKAKAQNAAAQRKRLAGKEALRRQEQAAAVRKCRDKDLTEAYSLTRKALQKLDQSFVTTPVSKHRYLRLAMEEMYRAQDNIALAITVEG